MILCRYILDSSSPVLIMSFPLKNSWSRFGIGPSAIAEKEKLHEVYPA